MIDGQTEVLAIHDKPLPMNGPYFEEVFYATPSELPGPALARIMELTAAAHKEPGITIGATHTEFRVRPDQDPMILETAARLGGGPIYRSVLLSTGVDMVHAVLDLALGRLPGIRVAEPPAPTGFYLFFADRAARSRPSMASRRPRPTPVCTRSTCTARWATAWTCRRMCGRHTDTSSLPRPGATGWVTCSTT